jgi:hypothetical protein
MYLLHKDIFSFMPYQKETFSGYFAMASGINTFHFFISHHLAFGSVAA